MSATQRVVGVLLAAVASIAIDACTDTGTGSASGGADGGRDPASGGGAKDGGATDDAGGNGALVLDAAPEAGTPTTGTAGASCAGLPATCGGSKSCCASNVVTGGAFNRSNDGAFPATVSDFKLDVYEVTVGRFRAFVNAGKGTQASPPAPGDGAHPKIASSGWDSGFNGSLTATSDTFKAALKCDAPYPAWTDAPVGNETLPMNCMTWFEAFAFCAWDGGRLPTETEWNYAAAGGGEQRAYPWGAGIDSNKASYECTADGSGAGSCMFTDMLPVGSKSPQGDGRWGQADLAGNVWEWALDVHQSPYRLAPCMDCADLQVASSRVFRGGAFPNDAYYLLASTRLNQAPTDRDYDVGVRCARSPTP
jgi:formylglycine-generating enzyme